MRIRRRTMGENVTDVQTPWFLTGNYAPVADEISAVDLPVSGTIPEALVGRYLRNGPNPASGTAGHWFFGDGMIHGVRLEEGRASWYRNRYVRTTKYERELAATAPETLRDRTASSANTHVLAHAGRVWALEEGHLPYEVSPELDTIGCDDFGGRLTTAFTAHPKLCPETGELHFFGYGVVPPYLTYHVLDATGTLVHSAPITVAKPTMMHDFMITREHAIFMDLPVVFDLEALRHGGMPFGWDETYGARVGIMPRFGTDADVRWFEVDPCYVFHPLNAYAEGSTVVCDVGRHATMWRDSMDDFAPAILHRWTFDLDQATVAERPLDDTSHSFPRVDDRVVGLRHRYGWAAAPRPGRECVRRRRRRRRQVRPPAGDDDDLRLRSGRPSRRVRVRAGLRQQRRGRGLGHGTGVRRRNRSLRPRDPRRRRRRAGGQGPPALGVCPTASTAAGSATPSSSRRPGARRGRLGFDDSC